MKPSSATDIQSKSFRFREEREDSWTELDSLIVKAEKSGLKSLTPDELFALPHLYRAVLSSLSVARAISLDINAVKYLEALTARAYLLMYGPHKGVWYALKELFSTTLPRAVRGIWAELAVSFIVFFIAAFAGFFLTMSEPDWFYSFVDASLAGDRVPGVSEADLRATLYPAKEELNQLDVFATSLFTHNARIGILAFALGFILGLPTLWLLFSNGTMLGAFFALYYNVGLGAELGGWLIIHGTTEIGAIILCGAAGLSIGRHYIFPGKLTRLESLALHGRKAAIVAFGCISMFMLAGLLEGFGRQLITSDFMRYTIGLAALVFWSGYYGLAGRNRQGENKYDLEQ